MIIQFSPIRSGSTLVYNYLKDLNKQVTKHHNYNFCKNNKYVITIRHPYNSIISNILRKNKEINIKTLNNNMKEYISNGGWAAGNHDF